MTVSLLRPTCRLAAQAASLLHPVFSCPQADVQLPLSLFDCWSASRNRRLDRHFVVGRTAAIVISASPVLLFSAVCAAFRSTCLLELAAKCVGCWLRHRRVARLSPARVFIPPLVFCPLRLRLDADPRSLDVCSRLLLRAVAVDCLPAALLLQRTLLIAAVLSSFLLLSASTALPRDCTVYSLSLLRCFRAVCFNFF